MLFIVGNLDTSFAFYHDALGMEVVMQPTTYSPNAMLMGLFNAPPGAQSRWTTVRPPGSPLKIDLIEYKDVDRKPARPRFQDPGAVSLNLFVRDIDSLIARLRETNARILSTGGQAVHVGNPENGSREIVVQDPDGFFIGITQRAPLPENTAPATSNVIGEDLEFVVADIDQAIRIYQDVLGFKYPPSKFTLSVPINDGRGTPGAQSRTTQARVPGRTGNPLFSNLVFTEYKDIDRKPVHTRVQDPGTATLSMNVTDLDATVKALQAAGVEVISKDGAPVGKASRYLVLRDPNNIYLELYQNSPANKK